jgi:hypothetical protein
MEYKTSELSKKYRTSTMKRSDLEKYMKTVTEASVGILKKSESCGKPDSEFQTSCCGSIE